MVDILTDIIDAELRSSIVDDASEKYAEPAKESISFGHISDQITKEDTLGFKPYVEAIADFLTSTDTKPPLTLSIEGEWGSGKSSFMAQLEKQLKEKKNISIINPHIKIFMCVPYINELVKMWVNRNTHKEYTITFNAWRHDNEDSLWAAFALNFIDQLSSQQPRLKRWRGHIKLLSSRFNWKNWEVLRSSAIWLIFIGATVTVFGILMFKAFQGPDPLYGKFIHSIYNPEQVISAITDYGFIAFGGVTTLIGGFVSLGLKLKNTVGSPFDVDFSKYFNSPDYEGRVNFIENFHEDFEKIVKAYAGKDKVYVFIDDLDRCEVPKAADLMQAINLMISYDPHLIFIVGMDREKVAASIAVKHEKLLPYLFQLDSESIDSRQSLKYGYEFIEKFIQVSFSVPKPTKDDFEKLLEDISKNVEENEVASDQAKTVSSKKSIVSIFKRPIQPVISDKGKGTEESDTVSVERIDETRDKMEKKVEKRHKTIIFGHNGHSKTVENIILMVAPALDNNPRRIKQFINLFSLRTHIADVTGLFDIIEDSPVGEHLTLEQLGKFVAISLKWPLLLNELDANRSLLAQLELQATHDSESIMDSHWCEEEKLMELLRFGLEYDTLVLLELNEHKYSLSKLNVDKLLQVSPRVILPEVDAGKFTRIPDIAMKFTRIEAGDFMMGSLDDEEGRYDNEGPAHKVTISKPFDLGTYPVTQREWKTVMGNNPSTFKGDDLPVEHVSWNDVQEFIRKLNATKGTDKYRLPSEAEWEYACRAGKNGESSIWKPGIWEDKTARYSFGDDESMLGEYAWYKNNSDGKTHPVGQKKPNPLGLYDMHGNVWEWIQDLHHNNYKGAPTDGSAWEIGPDTFRIYRGGGFSSQTQDCTSANRRRNDSNRRSYDLGFRILRNL